MDRDSLARFESTIDGSFVRNGLHKMGIKNGMLVINNPNTRPMGSCVPPIDLYDQLFVPDSYAQTVLDTYKH